MAAPFAEIEADIARESLAMLANATAIIGGQSVDGIFDNDYVDPFGMVSAAQPVFRCASAAVDGVNEGTVVAIGTASYAVGEIHPDGHGETLLFLRRSA